SAQHVGREVLPAEEAGKGTVEHVEIASQAAESGHYEPRPVAGEAGAAHGTPPAHDARAGVEVPGSLPFYAGLRFVTENEIAQCQLAHPVARQPLWRRGVVIACHPEPGPPVHEGQKMPAERIGQPRRAPAVMKTVAQAYDGIGPKAG